MSDARQLDQTNRLLERWILSPELRRYMAQAAEPAQTAMPTGWFIAVSRERGAGGSHIARLVGRELDFDVLDKELLDFIAQRYELPRRLLDVVDETKAHWINDLLSNFFTARVIPQSTYMLHLKQILQLAAAHGRVVFVGRGAHCLLPHTHGLAVRIVAPLECRVRTLMEQEHLSKAAALKEIEESDAGRQELCQYYGNCDVRDPTCYDLVLNTQRISPELACRQIVEMYQRLREEVTGGMQASSQPAVT